MRDGLFEEVTSHGYWRVNFQPADPEYTRKLTITQCKDIIEETSVSLRGWDYPHIPRNDSYGGLAPFEGYFEGWDDWSGHKEFWRMYPSAQFIDYRAFREDWGDEYQGRIDQGTVLSITNTVFQVTEILAFLEQLTRKGIYENGVRLRIGLHNTGDRGLHDLDPIRGIHVRDQITGATKIEINEVYSEEQILTSAMEIATRTSLEIFDKFCWTPSTDVIEKIRDDLIFYRR